MLRVGEPRRDVHHDVDNRAATAADQLPPISDREVRPWMIARPEREWLSSPFKPTLSVHRLVVSQHRIGAEMLTKSALRDKRSAGFALLWLRGTVVAESNAVQDRRSRCGWTGHLELVLDVARAARDLALAGYGAPV